LLKYKIEFTIAEYLKSRVDEYFNNLMEFKDYLFNHKRTSIDLSEDQLEEIYANGYYLFNHGKFNTAKKIFTSLAEYAPDNSNYWKAVGIVNQQLKKYNEAIDAYNSAIKINNDIASYIFRGESKILMGNKKEALKDFKELLEIAQNIPENASWRERAKFLIKIIEKPYKEVSNHG
jgi:secretion system chaperone SscA